MFLLYYWASLVTLRSLLALYPRVDPLEETPLAVKFLDNRLYMSPISHMKLLIRESETNNVPLTHTHTHTHTQTQTNTQYYNWYAKD